MKTLEKIIFLSFLATIPFLSCKQESKNKGLEESQVYRQPSQRVMLQVPRQQMEHSQYNPLQQPVTAEDVIDKYYATIRAGDKKGHLNCIGPSWVELYKYMVETEWETSVVPLFGNVKITSKEMVAQNSSETRKIYRVFEDWSAVSGFETSTGTKYYYLVKDGGEWKIDKIMTILNKNWLDTGNY